MNDKLNSFVENHWGDLNAWGLVIVGVALAVYGTCHNYKDLYVLGASAFTAGMIALKLRHTPKNGNGNGKP